MKLAYVGLQRGYLIEGYIGVKGLGLHRGYIELYRGFLGVTQVCIGLFMHCGCSTVCFMRDMLRVQV